MIYGQIQAQGLDLDLLFIDDNSPDGTGQLLDSMAAKDPRLTVLHRTGKQGVGSAHQAGIAYAYDHHYPVLITMDCDLTHPPGEIAHFIAAATGADIVLGSRFERKESLADWNLLRKFLTRFGHFLTRTLLRVPYDATGGFRLYRLERVDRRVFGLVESKGYSFFFESLYILCLYGAKVNEVPINLPKRTYGNSKMRSIDVFISLKKLLSLYCRSFHYKTELRKIRENHA